MPRCNGCIFEAKMAYPSSPCNNCFFGDKKETKSSIMNPNKAFKARQTGWSPSVKFMCANDECGMIITLLKGNQPAVKHIDCDMCGGTSWIRITPIEEQTYGKPA